MPCSWDRCLGGSVTVRPVAPGVTAGRFFPWSQRHWYRRGRVITVTPARCINSRRRSRFRTLFARQNQVHAIIMAEYPPRQRGIGRMGLRSTSVRSPVNIRCRQEDPALRRAAAQPGPDRMWMTRTRGGGSGGLVVLIVFFLGLLVGLLTGSSWLPGGLPAVVAGAGARLMSIDLPGPGRRDAGRGRVAGPAAAHRSGPHRAAPITPGPCQTNLGCAKSG
jgi:hypothetical protein